MVCWAGQRVKARQPTAGNGAPFFPYPHWSCGWGTTVSGVKVVQHAPRSGVIWSGTTTVRARPLPGSAHHGLLLITGSHGSDLSLPATDILVDWLDTLREWGYHRIRTSALSPSVADRLHDIGFTTVQDLVLLHREMNLPLPVAHENVGSISSLRLRAPYSLLQKSVLHHLLDIDRMSFGDNWCMDEKSFHEALTATHKTKIFVMKINGEIVGFIIVGVTSTNAFIQRLAVHPYARRTGVASQLLHTALTWIQKKHCTRVVVNTEILNHAAISLYSHFDFSNMEHGLEVLERELT